jgi:putative PepSY-like beta-lactamase-inhibitor
MKLRLPAVALTVAVMLTGASLASAAPKRSQKEEGSAQESRVKMKDLPAAVQQTVREQSKGATIRGLSREVENGETNYEVELRVNGHNRDVLIDPNGAVVEVEEQVTLASLPAVVRMAIEQNAAGGRVVLVESLTKGGTLMWYEAHVKKAGKSREIKINPEGQLVKD